MSRLRVLVTITITIVLAVQGWLGVLTATLSCRMFREAKNSPCDASECPPLNYEEYGFRGYYDLYNRECVSWRDAPRDTADGWMHGRTQLGRRLGWSTASVGLLTTAAMLRMLWEYRTKRHHQSYMKPFHRRTVNLLTLTAWLLFLSSSVLTMCMCNNLPPLGAGPICQMDYNAAARVLHVGTVCYACVSILLCFRCSCADDCCGWCWRDDNHGFEDDIVPQAVVAWVVDDDDELPPSQQQQQQQQQQP
eukprot:scaffold34803_cov199-Amphora_coffeaeformis.AAC.3